ncbi:MAG: ketoacyl-ACP synthase III [Saprospiraceae bacterium]|nr:ketoacyl-ACP synthase III [Saprospiraceae bacterium]
MIFRTVITGSGSYVPEEVVTNRDFTTHDFYAEDHQRIESEPSEIVRKFQEITGIEERRYAKPEMTASDMAVIASKIAIEDSGVDPETIDQIIFAHNFGNVIKHNIQGDMVPSLASRVKHELNIKSPACIPYDVLFGCPGWIQGVIQADAFFKAGIAKKALVIGAETLSRVIDPYDRDSMIFSDGAGATMLEYLPSSEIGKGIIGSAVQAHCVDEAYYIHYGKSNFPHSDPRVRYIKMKGRKVYEYAIKNVPLAMKACLDQSNVVIEDLKKIFIHQANEKMDDGIIKVFYKLYGLKDVPQYIMPMSIHKLGNSSVATVPTLYDKVIRGEMENQSIKAGDVVLFASVGAGMNINAVCYRC